LDYLITYGQLALEIGRGAVQAGMDPAQVVHAETRAAAARLVLKRCALGDWLLVKGSRGMRMELIIDRLREAIGP
jgi:UDP-N-acetylmuramoyl-tripeptide--D-alanyl-D-alanine ligase